MYILPLPRPFPDFIGTSPRPRRITAGLVKVQVSRFEFPVSLFKNLATRKSSPWTFPFATKICRHLNHSTYAWCQLYDVPPVGPHLIWTPVCSFSSWSFSGLHMHQVLQICPGALCVPNSSCSFNIMLKWKVSSVISRSHIQPAPAWESSILVTHWMSRIKIIFRCCCCCFFLILHYVVQHSVPSCSWYRFLFEPQEWQSNIDQAMVHGRREAGLVQARERCRASRARCSSILLLWLFSGFPSSLHPLLSRSQKSLG